MRRGLALANMLMAWGIGARNTTDRHARSSGGGKRAVRHAGETCGAVALGEWPTTPAPFPPKLAWRKTARLRCVLPRHAPENLSWASGAARAPWPTVLEYTALLLDGQAWPGDSLDEAADMWPGGRKGGGTGLPPAPMTWRLCGRSRALGCHRALRLSGRLVIGQRAEGKQILWRVGRYHS